MKTNLLPRQLTHSQAMQQIFLRTGCSMYPRRLHNTWAYDVAESEDEKRYVARKPLLTEDEIQGLYKLCKEERYNHYLWHMILMMLDRFDNQSRFEQATFLQKQIIAQAFYWYTIQQNSRN